MILCCVIKVDKHEFKLEKIYSRRRQGRVALVVRIGKTWSPKIQWAVVVPYSEPRWGFFPALPKHPLVSLSRSLTLRASGAGRLLEIIPSLPTSSPSNTYTYIPPFSILRR